MDAITLDLWKVGLAVVGIVLGSVGIIILALRGVLMVLLRGHRTLFDLANDARDRIVGLEKFALISDPENGVKFVVPERKKDARD